MSQSDSKGPSVPVSGSDREKATSASMQNLGYQDDSYDRYVESLVPCPGCGRVDEMDNIEGRSLCAACSLDERDDEEWAEWGDEEELCS